MSTSLQELREDCDRLLESGRRCCSRCFGVYPVEIQRPYSGGFLSGLCRTCWRRDLNRKEEAASSIPGGLSCSVQFENALGSDVAIPTASTRLAKYIGCRSDVRWYKKYGSSGEQ